MRESMTVRRNGSSRRAPRGHRATWMLAITALIAAAVLVLIRDADSNKSPAPSFRRADTSTTALTGNDAMTFTTLPIPASPSGAFGSTTNPLGSPAEAMVACGPSSPETTSLAIAISNSGFGAPCYGVIAGKPTPAVLTDTAVNSSTGLTISVEVTIAVLSSPVVGEDALAGPVRNSNVRVGPSSVTPAFPNPVPDVVPQNALYTSPTAPTDDPVSFALPPLPVGKYLLQLPTLPTVPSAVLNVSPGSPSGPTPTSTTVIAETSSTTDPQGTGVKVLQPSASDIQALVNAFDSWEGLPSTCSGEVVANSQHFAVITPSGDEWAIAQFRPSATCTIKSDGGGSVPPSAFGPFAERSGPPMAVFERSSGDEWAMNSEGGHPFPCPAPAGAAPGPGNGSLPRDVLAAWGLSYASNCAFVSYPPQPRR
jgi:hypothetical protein